MTLHGKILSIGGLVTLIFMILSFFLPIDGITAGLCAMMLAGSIYYKYENPGSPWITPALWAFNTVCWIIMATQ